MRFFAPALIFCGAVASSAQTPIVPHKMHFAGMTLVIRDGARREIQKDVDLLTQSPKYFNIKVERARTYFPIIERIFREERVPDDFKFLVLQESALIADAVSVSDAVGFWQFKDYTAQEMGMRVDREVDERMNIVAATRGAAKYIKQNNFMFNNWVYALQAYQMGAGGLKRMVGDDHDGSRHMEIDSDTYWYVKKFLAHKVAFEGAIKGTPQVRIQERNIDKGGSLSQIAERTSVELANLKEFNKWVKNDNIPSDKAYTIILPNGKFGQDFSALIATSAPKPVQSPAATKESSAGAVMEINEVPVIQARAGESLAAIAARGGIEVNQFIRFNELVADHRPIAGQYYFLERKKSRTGQEYHKTERGESLWLISQAYGIPIRRLKKLNRIDGEEELSEGTVLWLNSNKPRSAGQTNETSPVVELGQEVFDWSRPVNVHQPQNKGVEKKDRSGASVSPPADIDAPSAGPKLHEVRPGETLYAISGTYRIPVAELRRVNGLDASAGIRPGQVLKVPVNEDVTPTQRPAAIHEITASDTLYSVARQYGVTIRSLMEWNNKKDFTVSMGEKLKIPER